jgi:hypothetical protein
MLDTKGMYRQLGIIMLTADTGVKREWENTDGM